MSNVPKLQQAISQVQAARSRVAELAQGNANIGARINGTQIRDQYLAKPTTNAPRPKGNKEVGINNRRDTPRPSGGDPIRRKSNKMVPQVGGKVSTIDLFQKINHSHALRLEKDHPYDREPESMPVAYGVKSNLLNPVGDDRLEAVMTQYGPGVKMRGKEFLTVISSQNLSMAGGNVICAFPINPRLLQLPRLTIMSQLYTRFLFNKFNLHYHKSAGTQNNGSLQIFGVYDPTLNPCMRPGETLIAYAAQRGSTDLALYQDAVLTMDDSHFKDLLFLAPDDDLRWTMQGVVFVIASGAIVADLEAGKIMLEYEITLCNDDLDQASNIVQRNYRSYVLTFNARTTGTPLSGTVGGVPNGKYFVAFRSAPSAAVAVYQNMDARTQADPTRLFDLQKGSGCYATVTGGTVRFMYAPDLYSEDSSLSTFNKLFVSNASDAAVSTCTIDFYRYSDN